MTLRSRPAEGGAPPDGALPALLGDLARAGIRVRLAAGERLEVTAPRGALVPALRDRIGRHKPELLAWLAGATGPAVDAGPVPAPDPDGAHRPFPPSDLQRSFLVGSGEGMDLHVRPHQYMEWVHPDGLDAGRWERALNAALHRQRANLVTVTDDLQLQLVRDPAPVPVRVGDLRGRPPAEVEAHVRRVRDRMQRRELPLTRWPWLDVEITLHDGGARLHYNHNNFFSDGPGTSRLLEAVQQLYAEPDRPLPPLEITYRDCVLALAAAEDSAAGRDSRAYWEERLAGWPGAPDVPLAVGAPASGRSRLSRRDAVLPAADWSRFRARAAARGVTPTAAVCAAYAEVLALWSGSRHFLLNNMVTHRSGVHPQLGEVLGNFAALYPLEVDWRPDEPFAARAARLGARLLADLQHTAWSGSEVLQRLNQVRGTPGRAACPFVVGSGLAMGPLDRPAVSRLETPQVLLDSQFWQQRDGSLWLVWDVVEERFPPGLVDDLQHAYRTLLQRLADDDAAWEVTAPDLLPPAQRRQRQELNGTAPLPEGLLHDGFVAAARCTPQRPYVVTGGRTLTYGEVRRLADAVTVRLQRRGVGPGDRVAVVLPPGPEHVVAVLGVLGAGAAYTPLDPAWPDDRLRLLLERLDARVVLTGAPSLERLNGVVGTATTPVLDVDGPAGDARPAAVPRRPGDPAYVIYTSGSTGTPKGAVLDHGGPAATVRDVNDRFRIGADDVVLGVSSPCFDLSVYDVFGTAAAGGTLVLPGPACADPAGWLRLARREGVTVWNSVPALMELLVAEAEAADVRLPALRVVLLSGDWIPVALPARVRAVAPGARVVSLGGATEASIWSIAHPADDPDPALPSIPYGRPLTGQTWHVLDADGRDVPTWTPGDLYIGGRGPALGYLDDDERTAAAFVRHPRTGERLYRTGDRGRYLPGGELEFLGRSDLQVKIHGFRVEPGEVEAALAAHPAVRHAVVVARGRASGRQLAGFVTARPGGAAPTVPDLGAHLARTLPAHLVPAHLEVLDRLPLTANGKVDRGALEALDTRSPGAPQPDREPAVPPRTPLEATLLAAWQEILDVPAIGVHDDFFVLGGQSFAALRLVGLLRRRLLRRVPLGALLEARTVAALAARLEQDATGWSSLVRLRPGEGTPWFWVHPSGGDVLCYRELATLLDAPAYAFQAPGPGCGRPVPVSVAETAEAYLAELLAVRPAGPYRLGGWSSGGVLAFELARRLERRGERVERLVLVDTPSPRLRDDPDDLRTLLWFVEDLGVDPAALDDGTCRRLADLPDDGARLALLLAGLDRVQDVDPVELLASLAVFRGVVRAVGRYRPTTAAADLLVLRATEGRVPDFAGHPASGQADWGWSALTTGRVTSRRVPGTHRSMLAAPHVAVLAAAVSATPQSDGERGTHGG